VLVGERQRRHPTPHEAAPTDAEGRGVLLTRAFTGRVRLGA
jgi:hypothetical protein